MTAEWLRNSSLVLFHVIELCFQLFHQCYFLFLMVCFKLCSDLCDIIRRLTDLLLELSVHILYITFSLYDIVSQSHTQWYCVAYNASSHTVIKNDNCSYGKWYINYLFNSFETEVSQAQRLCSEYCAMLLCLFQE